MLGWVVDGSKNGGHHRSLRYPSLFLTKGESVVETHLASHSIPTISRATPANSPPHLLGMLSPQKRATSYSCLFVPWCDFTDFTPPSPATRAGRGPVPASTRPALSNRSASSSASSRGSPPRPGSVAASLQRPKLRSSHRSSLRSTSAALRRCSRCPRGPGR